MVSIPMLRAEIHLIEFSEISGNWRFNSHATRGNSLVRRRSTYYKIGFQFPCYAREFTKAASHGITWSIVSIPMLRAEIHSGSLEYLHHNSSFNSHDTRGNSPMRAYEAVEIDGVSIPMLRAGIHVMGCPNGMSRCRFNSHATRGNSRLASAMPILSVFQRSIVRIGKIS